MKSAAIVLGLIGGLCGLIPVQYVGPMLESAPNLSTGQRTPLLQYAQTMEDAELEALKCRIHCNDQIDATIARLGKEHPECDFKKAVRELSEACNRVSTTALHAVADHCVEDCMKQKGFKFR